MDDGAQIFFAIHLRNIRQSLLMPFESPSTSIKKRRGGPVTAGYIFYSMFVVWHSSTIAHQIFLGSSDGDNGTLKTGADVARTIWRRVFFGCHTCGLRTVLSLGDSGSSRSRPIRTSFGRGIVAP